MYYVCSCIFWENILNDYVILLRRYADFRKAGKLENYVMHETYRMFDQTVCIGWEWNNLANKRYTSFPNIVQDAMAQLEDTI